MKLMVPAPLDPAFRPLEMEMRAYEKDVAASGRGTDFAVLILRNQGYCDHYQTRIFPDGEDERTVPLLDRLIKTLLWARGGYKIVVYGSEAVFAHLKAAYRDGGQRAFDADFMATVYERPFEVEKAEKIEDVLLRRSSASSVGRHLKGCRIGFDAGGSDRKVSAVIDGEPVYSEEVVWFPKINSDPDYHYNGIVTAFKSAAEHLPRVDAVGISSAGVYIDNRTMNASLFLKVPQDLFDQKVKDIYIRAVHDTFGDIPCSVVNDGDVTALAGALSLGRNNMLGIAMGTSEAAGYVDREGRITGWLNELAFVPVDANPDAMRDEWSGDIGCGVKYFSQDGVIKLAPRAGIELDESLSPAEKLKVVQKLMEADDPRAAAVFRSLGCYLAHTLYYYNTLYGCENLLLLGRVMSGKGGDVLLESCREVLKDEYPALAETLSINLPDEKFRRVGQSAVAASLPEV